jgi:hypothetical protein
VDNIGLGGLRWEIRDLPEGVSLVAPATPAPATSAAIAQLSVRPLLGKTADSLVLTVRLWDQVGQAAYDRRTGPPEACWRDHTVRVPVQRRAYGPLLVPARTLLLGGPVRSAQLYLRNAGEVEVPVVAHVDEGYSLQVAGRPSGTEVMLQLSAGEWCAISVCTTMGLLPIREGKVTLEAPGLPKQEVALVPIAVAPLSPPTEALVVAVDFGTTKSVVVLHDQHRVGAEPRPILWPRPDCQEPAPWIPSVVAWDGGRSIRFGWEVGATEHGRHIVRGMKMRLREEDPRVRGSVICFLRHLLERAAAAANPDHFQAARFVFTLPVMATPDEQENLRALTLSLVLEAGASWGLREEQCDFYLEPECAAVDFLHHLQSAAVTGQAQAMPRPGDWLCVLDMGGGTTDVTFARLGIDGNGVPSFDECRNIGFPGYAGTYIDEAIYTWCVEQWRANHRLKGIRGDARPAAQIPVEEAARAEGILLEGEGEPIRREEPMEALPRLKEQVYASVPPTNQVWDLPTRRENHVTLCPEKLSRDVLAPLAHGICIQGLPGSGNGVPLPAIRARMAEWGLSAGAIRFLCLTGGTSQIPDFEQKLRETVLISPRMERVVTPEAIRLNVARGAARRPGTRLRGRLPFPIQIAWGEEIEELLRTGVVPGERRSARRYLDPGERCVVELRVLLPGQFTRTLFAYDVANTRSDATGLFLEAQLEYNSQQVLRIRLVWVIEPEEEALGWMVIQQIPAA